MATQPRTTALSGGIYTLGRKTRVAPTLAAPLPLPRAGVEIPVAAAPPAELQVTKRDKQRLLTEARGREEQLPSLLIEELALTIMSAEEIRTQSVVRITSTDAHGPKSVNDPQMGVTEENIVCSTCGKDNIECPAHLGRIELNVPIINPLFRREVIRVLNCVCNSCGGLLLNEAQIREQGILRLTGAKRLQEIEKQSLGLPCIHQHGPDVAHCVPNPTYLPVASKDARAIVYTYDEKPTKDSKTYIKPIEEIERIFAAISEHDAQLLGFMNNSHPSRMIMRVFPVIPPKARPPAAVDGEIRPNPLTNLYIEIVRYNNLLETAQTEGDRQRTIQNLNHFIDHLIDNSDGKYTVGKQEIAGLKQLIQGKEAIVRGLMMGKRVNYTGRTVLGPDPSLKFGQIRVPRAMASVLTIEVTVNNHNLKRMQQLLEAGQITYITPGRGKFRGTRIAITDEIKRNLLEGGDKLDQLGIGDKVERWLENGDYVIFNRQPTLHKQSMMGYEVVLGDQLTFGLHLFATRPHNADFDGDEGNLHVPQLVTATAEVALLMGIQHCIMSAQTNQPMMGAVLDTLTGAYLLTSDKEPVTEAVAYERVGNGPAVRIPLELVNEPAGADVDRYILNEVVYSPEGTPVMRELILGADLYFDCLMAITNRESLYNLDERLAQYNVPRFGGRALFSALFPEDFYYKKSGRIGDKENTVLVMNGVLVQGIITKDHIGGTHGSIIQVMWKNYGMQRVVDFLTDLPFVIDHYLAERGFSVGLRDCFPTDQTHKEFLKREIARAKLDVEALGGKIADPLEEERREKQIIMRVNNIKDIGYTISTEKLAPDNALNVMALSGAKGATFNIAQITGLLGQQFFKGQRIKKQISRGTRSLPYFEQGDEDIEARGFIQHSFLEGLTPAEFMFHHIAGREGLIDTALKTSETGHLTRKMMETLRDLSVAYDGSVRNRTGHIFQFTYGYDGFDAAELQFVKTQTGTVASFVDLENLADRLNIKYGFGPQH